MSDLITMNHWSLTSSQWQRLTEYIIGLHIYARQTSLVEAALNSDETVLSLEDNTINMFGPDGINDWDIAKCLEWMVDEDVQKSEYPDEYHDAVKDIGELPYFTVEKIAEGTGITQQEGESDYNFACRVQNVVSKRQIDEVLLSQKHIDDWACYTDQWRNVVRKNYGVKEVNNWYLVSEKMAEELAKQGCVILDPDGRLGGPWWGRCGGGQAIYMDYQMQVAASKLCLARDVESVLKGGY